jgi:UDPglucose--hexose-1-phosphate uridylyltransferase
MSDLRQDALHDTWVIIAPERHGRPRDQHLQTVAEPDTVCPFCPGHEAQTPPEILATGRGPHDPPDRPPWRVRVCPNRYPAVGGAGCHHEVVVFTPDHGRDLAQLTAAEITEILAVIRARITALAADPQVAAVIAFQNAGAGAGASLAHPHGQILATPVMPAILRTELAACERWRRQHGTCLLCDLVAPARHEERVIDANAGALLLAPWASRFAYEMLLLPRRHEPSLAAATDLELAAVAALLGAACRSLQALRGTVAYNLVLHSAPSSAEDFHWHLEFLPRLAPLAGFETGTGFFINPVDPAAAARSLRTAAATALRKDGA